MSTPTKLVATYGTAIARCKGGGNYVVARYFSRDLPGLCVHPDLLRLYKKYRMPIGNQNSSSFFYVVGTNIKFSVH